MTASLLLAKAGSGDAPGSDLALTVTWLLAIGAIAIAALVPFRLASSGGRRRGEALTTMLIVWAVIASVCAIRGSMSRAKWEQEYQMRLQSGFYDPADPQNVPPAWPWKPWAALGAGYVVLLVIAVQKGRRDRPGFDEKPNQ
jgi:hypothetical protein